MCIQYNRKGIEIDIDGEVNQLKDFVVIYDLPERFLSHAQAHTSAL